MIHPRRWNLLCLVKYQQLKIDNQMKIRALLFTIICGISICNFAQKNNVCIMGVVMSDSLQNNTIDSVTIKFEFKDLHYGSSFFSSFSGINEKKDTVYFNALLFLYDKFENSEGYAIYIFVVYNDEIKKEIDPSSKVLSKKSFLLNIDISEYKLVDLLSCSIDVENPMANIELYNFFSGRLKRCSCQ